MGTGSVRDSFQGMSIAIPDHKWIVKSNGKFGRVADVKTLHHQMAQAIWALIR